VISELEALVKSGADVIVFCRQSPHKNFVLPFPIKYERVDSAETLTKRIKETSRTIVHAHFAYPTVTDMVWPACEAAGIPFTFIAHAQDIFRYENDKRNRLGEVASSKLCRKVFVLSRFHHEYVIERGVPREKVIINPNAVNVEQFAAAACEKREERRFRKIIAVSRFVEKKGLSNLIRAAALINDLDVQIDIYGYGELEAEYKRIIQAQSIENVFLKGALSPQEVVAVMRGADLFACPSVRAADGDMDGIPTSLVESMAAGLPVLTTALSGIPDLVIDGVTGLITDSNPEAIAHSIRRFYDLPDLQVRNMILAAQQHAKSQHDVTRLVGTLMRVWEGRTVDIVIVSWNNLKELKAVVDRIIANTATPYHLIICDNQSEREPLRAYLRDLHRTYPNVTAILNNVNAMVGPGTNLALQHGQGEFIIYICGKEGISFAKGWELPFVRELEADPSLGLVGSIGHSPTYLTGEQYPTGIPLFSKFRNQEFAKKNPRREFGHIQGGLFGMRRKMYNEIGGFSDDVPHDYTDVEYSYYAESRGWKLGEVPNVLALFNKSRPTLSQRLDETVKVAHPVLLGEIDTFDAVIRGELKHCNICNWFGQKFRTRFDCPDYVGCPDCGSTAADRSLFKWLSESNYMYRRLPALAIGLEKEFAKVWEEQFQGPRHSWSQFVATLQMQQRLPNKAGSLNLAYLRCGLLLEDQLPLIAKELKRVLKPGAPVLIQLNDSHCSSAGWEQFKEQVSDALDQQTFTRPTERAYFGRALAPSWISMLEIRKLPLGANVSSRA
jgi:glycosyltransferase involved in cell wall biosynthesis/GT2 family glycosyltransferase